MTFWEKSLNCMQDLQQKSESGEPTRDNTVEDSTQEDSDDEGEVLMDTDDEEEDIESGTEEDRAFMVPRFAGPQI